MFESPDAMLAHSIELFYQTAARGMHHVVNDRA
jgi:hypothetical protein